MSIGNLTKRDRFQLQVLSARCQRIGKTACLAIAVVAVLCAEATTVLAQPSTAATAIYGRGVHSYFAGDSTQAEQYFTQAIQTGTRDPRPYYFRAMLRLRQGRQFEAENDMRIGASFEARNPGVQHSIGRSLQRIQGPHRRTLEKFRRQGRLELLQQGQQRTQQRYERLERRGPELLHREAPLPLAQPVQPPQTPGSTTAPPVAAPAVEAPASSTPQPTQPAPVEVMPEVAPTETADDPFGAPAPVTPEADPFGVDAAPAPTTDPAPTAVPVEPDPFEETPSPAAESTTEEVDLFGEPIDAPPAEAEPTVEPEMTEADPFGAEEPAEETPTPEATDADPFDDESAEEPMEAEEAPAEAEADPFGEPSETVEEEADPFDETSEPVEEEADPFGEPSEIVEEEAGPSEETSEPVEEEADPFGESTDSAEEPADEESTPEAEEEDPFGESMEDESDPFGDSEDSAEEEPAGESEEDDPFGDFGGVSPTPGVGGVAASLPRGPTAVSGSPAGQLFYSLGKWIGSGGQSSSSRDDSRFGSPATGVVQAEFELGPVEEAFPAPSAEAADAEVGPFAELPTEGAAQEDPEEDVDPFGEF